MNLIFAGDLVLDEPDPDHWLSGIAPALRAADLAIGHLEVPHSTSRVELQGDVPAPGADPAHLAALARAGFGAVSLAGNHIADCGDAASPTRSHGLDEAGMQHAGAGLNLAAARKPVVLMRQRRAHCPAQLQLRWARSAWATARSGRLLIYAYRARATAGRSRRPPHSNASIHDFSRRHARLTLRPHAIRRLRDRRLSQGHRAHARATCRRTSGRSRMLQSMRAATSCSGITRTSCAASRLYRGKPIFHGLGNGCVVTRALRPDQSHPARAAWARKRRELFGFEPDPAYPSGAVSSRSSERDARRACALLTLALVRVGFVPVHVEPPGRPVIAAGEAAQRIAHYVEAITIEAGLPPLALEITGEGVWLT